MNILHGTWIPEASESFAQKGAFYLWVETEQQRRFKAPRHNRHLPKTELAAFLGEHLGFRSASGLEPHIRSCCFWLPSSADAPLPSPELARFLASTQSAGEVSAAPSYRWSSWQTRYS